MIGDGSLENPLYVNNVQQCYGGNRAQNLTRSHLFTCPDDNSRLLLVAGDEASSSVSLFRLLFWEKLPDLSDEVQTRMVVIDFQALVSFSFIDIYFHCDKFVSFLISTVRLHTHCFDTRFSLFIQWSTIWLTICAKLILLLYLSPNIHPITFPLWVWVLAMLQIVLLLVVTTQMELIFTFQRQVGIKISVNVRYPAKIAMQLLSVFIF